MESSVQERQQWEWSRALDQSFDTADERRRTDYKPNIWDYDAIQSLASKCKGDVLVKQAEKPREDVRHLLTGTPDLVDKLELVDWIEKLGLAHHFNEEIKDALDAIAFNPSQEDLPSSARRFRILRQHGYNVSQDVFNDFVNRKYASIEEIVALLEASNLGKDGEGTVEEVKAFATRYLRGVWVEGLDNGKADKVSRALELPMHQRVRWFDVKWCIDAYEKDEKCNFDLLRLAKLNFNMVQATHQDNLRDVSMWWTDLGLAESISFTRDRLVESFLWAVGVAFEPEFASLRKWLTKAISLVLVIDDIFDAYGSLEELEIFTHAVEMLDPNKVQMLPQCMKICFQALYNTILETAKEIQEEKGGSSIMPHLWEAWGDFCKALLVEAKWFYNGHTPTLQEYLDNGWVSSCGPLLCVHAFPSVIRHKDPPQGDDMTTILEENRDIVHFSSLIIRLCNDLGTSTAELERGDAASSILCYMQEANAPEEVAREHIKGMISTIWKKINGHQSSPREQPFARIATNMARVAHCIYQHGDGFGVQDRETRAHILSLLIKPLSLD